MRAAACVGGCLLLVLAGVVRAEHARAPQQPQQPVFRGGVELVTFDVRVVDKDGKPVPGLTVNDFTVTLDGQARPVRALDYMTSGSSTTTDIAAPSGPAKPNAPAPATSAPRGGRVILFVLDDVSARPLEIVALVTAAQRMLPTFDPADLVGLVTTSGLGGFVPPTRDRAAVSSALHGRGLVGRADIRNMSPFVTVDEAMEISRDFDQSVFRNVVWRECGEQTARSDQRCPNMVRSTARMIDAKTTGERDQELQGYSHAISALMAEPAPRVLIALTKGFPLSPYVPSPLEAVSQAAAAADVGFYALVPADDAGVDLSDNQPPPKDPSIPSRAQARVKESRFLVDGTHSLAIAAGGEAFGVVGQADRFLHRIDTETSALYRLGVELPPGSDPGRFVGVKVTVDRPGVTVRTNVHALRRPAEAPAPAAAVDPMRQRLDQGGNSFGVTMQLGTAVRRDSASGHGQMLITVDIPAATPAPLKALFAVLNAAGAIVQSGRAEITPVPNDNYHVTFPVPIEEGDYRVRVVASDANGNIGSVDQPAPAHLRHLGPLVASDLLLAAGLGEGSQPHLLTLDTLPAKAMTLQGSLELYASDPPPPTLRVRMSIASELGGAPLAEVDLTPTPRNGALVVSSTMPVEDLNPGRYVFSAVVTSDGQALGTVTAKVRKDDK